MEDRKVSERIKIRIKDFYNNAVGGRNRSISMLVKMFMNV
jgi:hypothetical protein